MENGRPKQRGPVGRGIDYPGLRVPSLEIDRPEFESGLYQSIAV